jgi:serine/threonine protein kinase
VRLRGKVWRPISSEDIDLLLQMLERDPLKRIAAKQALIHNWFALEHIGNSQTSVCKNVIRHNGETIFNVVRIKPEFNYSTINLFLPKPLHPHIKKKLVFYESKE